MQVMIEIDDEIAIAMLAANGIGPDEMAEAETTPEEAAGLVLSSILAGNTDVASPGVPFDLDAIRSDLIRIESAARPIDVDISPSIRGVPYQVWTPDANWQTLEASPRRYPELEDHLTSLYEIIDVDPRLRTIVSRRYNPANEPIQEGMFAEILDPVEIKIRMRGASYKCRISPIGAMVVGTLDGLPQLVRGTR